VLANDQWHHFASRVTTSALENYIEADGSNAGSNSHSIAFPAGCDSVTINPKYAGQLGYSCEHQVHSADRSLAWIAHEYDQTDSQSAFWGTWANVAVPTSVTTKISASSRMLISGLLFNRRNRRIL